MNKLHEQDLLVVFLTYGMSLATWHKLGTLDRELAIYRKHIDSGRKICFVSYGQTSSEMKHLPRQAKVAIVWRMNFFGFRIKIINLILSFLWAPYFAWLIRNKNVVMKTNQLVGSWVAIVIKIISRRHKLFVRTGYDAIFFEKKRPFSLETKLKVLALNGLRWSALKVCDVYSVSSEVELGKLKKLTPHGRVKLLPNYVPDHFFLDPNQSNIDLKTKLYQLLYVGRIAPQKNLEKTIQSVKDLELTLDIVGSGVMPDRIREECWANYRLLGVVDGKKLPDLMKQYGFFLLLSEYEGMPKVLIEAMGAGLVPIVSDIPAHREIVVHEFNGFLIDLNDCYSTQLKIIFEGFSHGKFKYQEISLNAQNDCKEKYSLNKVFEFERAIFKELKESNVG